MMMIPGGEVAEELSPEAVEADLGTSGGSQRETSTSRRVWRQLHTDWFGRTGLALLGLVFLIAVVGPLALPFSPNLVASSTVSILTGPSTSHWFGTDELG